MHNNGMRRRQPSVGQYGVAFALFSSFMDRIRPQFPEWDRACGGGIRCKQIVLLADAPLTGEFEALREPQHGFKTSDGFSGRVERLERRPPTFGMFFLSLKWSLSTPWEVRLCPV